MWHYSWLCKKKDYRGKIHVYGSLATDVGRHFRVWGEVSSAHMHLKEYSIAYDCVRTALSVKLGSGYKFVTGDAKLSFPGVTEDINMQFAIKVLQQL